MRPDVDVRMAYMRTQGQKLALSDGSLDVGYMIGPFDHSEFHSLSVAADPLCAIMPSGHPLAARETIDPAELADAPLVLGDMAEWEAYRWRLDEMFASVGVKAAPALEASNTLALIGLVRAGLGVTIYPGRLKSILGEGLTVRPLADFAFPRRNDPRLETHEPHGERAQLRRHRPAHRPRRRFRLTLSALKASLWTLTQRP